MTGKWTNWVGNQTFDYASYAQPANEKEVVKAVKKALEKTKHKSYGHRSFFYPNCANRWFIT